MQDTPLFGEDIDPGLLGRLVQAARTYQQVAQMQAAISQNEHDLHRMTTDAVERRLPKSALETLELHTSIMREHLERRLEPAQQQAVQALLSALDQLGHQVFQATSQRLAEPPPATPISYRDLGSGVFSH